MLGVIKLPDFLMAAEYPRGRKLGNCNGSGGCASGGVMSHFHRWIESRQTMVALLFLITHNAACAPEENLPQPSGDSQPLIAETIGEALTFHASFDSGTDADFGLGDREIYTAPSYSELEQAEVGLHNPDIVIAASEGRFGSALRFQKKNETAVFYRADGNVDYSNQNWSGTISFWLRLTPAKDLEPGFCDPIQVTDQAYDDSAIWVDFTSENPRQFRLGVFGEREAWNPQNLPPAENPDFAKRLVVVDAPPFSRDRWPHVLITYSGLGSSGGGTASLYVDARLQGRTETISEPFGWDLSRGAIRLGVNYVGFYDEVALFNRPLSEGEIQALYQLEEGAAVLHP